jgi:hypothetical protein
MPIGAGDKLCGVVTLTWLRIIPGSFGIFWRK